jgi:glycosyltransferase involved in cell wall biosynthesis
MIASGPPVIVLDLSRLLSRAHRNTPTGIDRVELAYAKGLLERARDRLLFAGMNNLRMFGLLPASEATDFVTDVAELWRTGSPDTAQRVRSAGNRLKRRLLPHSERSLHVQLRKKGAQVTYLNASHHHLDQPRIFSRLKSAANARVAVFVHDIIPISYPEYARPGQKERHEKRMMTAAQYADRIIVNSADTEEIIRPLLEKFGRLPPITCAPLGIDAHLSRPEPAESENHPYFVMIGTIEPRKNHILLLNIWRELAREMGSAAPVLHIVGHRGWENEHVLDLMERCEAIQPLVIEHGQMSDRSLAQLLAGARALLLPSFAEGYGLPVGEALTLGTPVICSDLPVLREVGQETPDYLDPLDGLGWKKALIDYASKNSTRREAQFVRLARWRGPTWQRHLDIVMPLLLPSSA